MTTAKKDDKTLDVRIKFHVKDKGDGVKETYYNCSGYHVAEEHRELLPKVARKNRRGKEVVQTARKLVPGEVYTLPEDVAKHYLHESPNLIEAVF